MKITLLGAAQTVTGSCYVIEAAGTRFAVDCGMFQGNKEMDARNFETSHYRAEELDFILLTHAHIDHSGLLPRMVAEGFKGTIYATPPTKELAALMLEDSAHIQQMEHEWKIQHSKRKGQNNIEAPLYTIEDAKKTAAFIVGKEFNSEFVPHTGIRVKFHYAGHILGAAFLEIHIEEDGTTTRFVFSGDLGRPGALLVPKPEYPAECEWLFLESTYGDRDHKGEQDTMDEMADAIQYSYGHKEKVIIPTFAVERAQEVLYSLMQMHDKGMIPADMPIYLDSPLAIRATEVFLEHGKDLSVAGNLQLSDIKNPRYNIHYSLSTDESRALNSMEGPAIILSASGMANAGRIKHHLKHNIWKPGASVVIVGYQAVGTLGRKLVDGASTVRIFNDSFTVKAKIFLIGGFSAHAGQSQLIDWIEKRVESAKRLHVVLTHGELEKQKKLLEKIEDDFKKCIKTGTLRVSIPGPLDDITIEGLAQDIPVETPMVSVAQTQARPINWTPVRSALTTRFDEVLNLIDTSGSRLAEDQEYLRERLLELNNELLTLLTEV